MSMYKQFKSDADLETKGVVIDYGDFRVTIARAGGSNHKFAKVANAKLKPYKRQMEAGSLSPELDKKVTAEIYAAAVVLNWETKVDGEFKKGIEGPDGELLDFTEANVVSTFLALPDLMLDIIAQAGTLTVFQEADREQDLGN